MKTLPRNIILQKNLLIDTGEWLILLDVYLTPILPIYIVKNTEDVVFEGRTYTAFPFSFDGPKQSSKGELPIVKLSIEDPTRTIHSYIEDYEGLVGQVVVMRIVSNALLSENYAELTYAFQILSCSASVMGVNFELGAPSPMKRRFPLHRYLSDYCAWAGYFKGVGDVAEECGYAGTDATCEGTLAACKLKGNSVHFGGFPGLGKGGVRFA